MVSAFMALAGKEHVKDEGRMENSLSLSPRVIPLLLSSYFLRPANNIFSAALKITYCSFRYLRIYTFADLHQFAFYHAPVTITRFLLFRKYQ